MDSGRESVDVVDAKLLIESLDDEPSFVLYDFSCFVAFSAEDKKA